MDLNTVASAIGQFGFPLVACIYLAWLAWKQQNTLAEFSSTLASIKETLSNMNARLEALEKGILQWGRDYTD